MWIWSLLGTVNSRSHCTYFNFKFRDENERSTWKSELPKLSIINLCFWLYHKKLVAMIFAIRHCAYLTLSWKRPNIGGLLYRNNKTASFKAYKKKESPMQPRPLYNERLSFYIFFHKTTQLRKRQFKIAIC